MPLDPVAFTVCGPPGPLRRETHSTNLRYLPVCGEGFVVKLRVSPSETFGVATGSLYIPECWGYCCCGWNFRGLNTHRVGGGSPRDKPLPTTPGSFSSCSKKPAAEWIFSETNKLRNPIVQTTKKCVGSIPFESRSHLHLYR